MLSGQFLNLVIIQQVVLFAHAILHGIEPLARLIWCGPMGQMAASIQRHAKDRIARLQEGLEDTLVGLAARIRLDIGKFASKQLTGALNSQGLGNVHVFTSAVVAPSHIAFGIFVGHDRALRLHHCP